MAEDIHEKVQELGHMVNANTSDIETIGKVVLGNGDEGMDETVRNLANSFSDYIIERKETIKREEKKRDALQIGMILALFSSGLASVGTMILMLFRFWPVLLEIEEIAKALP